jgi:hypothetical protein
MVLLTAPLFIPNFRAYVDPKIADESRDLLLSRRMLNRQFLLAFRSSSAVA